MENAGLVVSEPLTPQTPRLPLRLMVLPLIVAPTLPEQVPNGVVTCTELMVALVVELSVTFQKLFGAAGKTAWTDEHVELPVNTAWVTWMMVPVESVVSVKVDVQGTGTPSIERLVGPVAITVELTGVACNANTGAATIVPATITHAIANALNCAFISIPRNKS